MDNLCIGVAYVTMHTHRLWHSCVEDLVKALSNTPEEAICLITIFKYMASECEDEGVVIEESLRESFFDYLDVICEQVIG